MWVGVVLEHGRFVEAFHVAGFAAVLERSVGAEVLGIDMPIGLTDPPRAAELEARQVLGKRASTLFLSPPPGVRGLAYPEANARCRRVRGTGFSKQSFNLLPRIFEVADHADARCFEVHPELCFHALTGEVLASKKSWTGLMQRLAALRSVGIELPADIGDQRVGIDDVLDAAVAAWTAGRIARGTAVHWPRQGEGPRIWA